LQVWGRVVRYVLVAVPAKRLLARWRSLM
jgi:hypothetical protein